MREQENQNHRAANPSNVPTKLVGTSLGLAAYFPMSYFEAILSSSVETHDSKVFHHGICMS